jgi:hypothetical protein
MRPGVERFAISVSASSETSSTEHLGRSPHSSSEEIAPYGDLGRSQHY